MKLKLLQHLSGVDGVKEIGEKIEVTEQQAVAFIEKGIAEPLSKKALDEFNEKIEAIKAKKLEDEAKAKAILEEGRIKNELNRLYLEVVLKEAELNGEVLSEQETFDAVEDIAKRDAVVDKETKGK